jgi:hypothetical protein
MEPQDNKRIALQKAISAHEQAGAALSDLTTALSEAKYAVLAERIAQNLADLQAEASTTTPGENV